MLRKTIDYNLFEFKGCTQIVCTRSEIMDEKWVNVGYDVEWSNSDRYL